ncbi:hypothetical protein LCGC14_0371620 [marine sediment metagenome]|uniref:Uncharacterized protein n=1 Tax=marine sediment metagenome TaxID=412755 RepID=A0A0F9T553_9ZZZZ
MNEYPCGECGKYTDLVGGVCSDCNRMMGEDQQRADELHYSLMAKCLQCEWLIDDYQCSEYRGMPVHFFRRQKYCKCFTPIDYNNSRW